LLAVAALGGAAAMFLTMCAVRHKTRRKKFMLALPLIIAAQALIVAVAFNQSLSVSHISVTADKIDGEVKLALITDFHACDFGDGQRELIDATDAEQPDAILLCGDIFDDVLPPDNTIELIADIAAKYPCYYVTGNHEFWSGNADDFKDILCSHNVNVLEGASETLEIHGAKIAIGGIDDPDCDRCGTPKPRHTPFSLKT
jgi:predicted MPP superfamily phosphohydrolase